MSSKINESVAVSELKQLLKHYIVKGNDVHENFVNGDTIETYIIGVTPSLAETLLTRNGNNRPLTNGAVKKYAETMINGEWVYDGTALVFDKYGNLINGQHRLSAVFKSGKTIVFKIEIGYRSEIFTTMDIGRNRSGGDVLSIAGIENYALASTTANYVFNFSRGVTGTGARMLRVHHSGAMTHSKLVEFVRANPEISDSISLFLSTKKKVNRYKNLIPPYMVTGFHYMFSKKNEEDANNFIFKFMTGDNIAIDSPIYLLRERLLASSQDRAQKLNHSEISKLVVVAWNKYRKGEKAKSLKIPDLIPLIA